MTDVSNADLAGVAHWDATERNVAVSLESFGPTPGIRGFARRQWHDLLVGAIAANTSAGSSPGDRSLLELGCGGSAFLPYFARELGCKISGIDYSEGGINMARALCAAHDVPVDLLQVDFFDAPTHLQNAFDVVVSFGVVEHFSDSPATVSAFSRFLKPGGTLITIVPNMQGLCGIGQKVLDRSVYDIHETIDVPRLRDAHRKAGLEITRCEYFLFSNFGVINPGLKPSTIKRAAFQALRALTVGIWAIESLVGRLPANRWTSPYVVCVARKPEQS
ncbi:MAG: class I SAM-dependent methyltransferase [Novosphingobium sp.]